MQVVLVMFRDAGEPRSFAVTHDITVIGRRDDCDLRIPLGEVSRKHCRLVQEAGTLRVEDLGSSNGTYVNAERIQHATLGAGDSLQVGPIVFVVQIDGTPEVQDMQPVRFAEPEAAADAGAGAGVGAGAAGVGAGVGAGAAAAGGGDDEFDPLEAINAPDNEDSAFEFTIEEEMAEAAVALGGGDGGSGDGAVADSEQDVADVAPADLDELDADAVSAQELEGSDEDAAAPIEMVDADEQDAADDVIDLEESEHDQKA